MENSLTKFSIEIDRNSWLEPVRDPLGLRAEESTYSRGKAA